MIFMFSIIFSSLKIVQIIHIIEVYLCNVQETGITNIQNKNLCFTSISIISIHLGKIILMTCHHFIYSHFNLSLTLMDLLHTSLPELKRMIWILFLQFRTDLCPHFRSNTRLPLESDSSGLCSQQTLPKQIIRKIKDQYLLPHLHGPNIIQIALQITIWIVKFCPA